jgi:hypothetical protein
LFRECLLQRVTKTHRFHHPAPGHVGLAIAAWHQPVRAGLRNASGTEHLLCLDEVTASDVVQRGHTLGLYGGCASEGDKVGVGAVGWVFVRFEMFLVASACGVSAISYKFCSIVTRLTPPLGLNAPGLCDSVENPGP